MIKSESGEISHIVAGGNSSRLDRAARSGNFFDKESQSEMAELDCIFHIIDCKLQSSQDENI